MENYYDLIQQHYLRSEGDSTELFQTVLLAADEIGLDQALAYLEQCVTEKRLAWLAKHHQRLGKAETPVLDGYRLFYEAYLKVSVPNDGAIVELTGQRMVMRWWNPCPTLVVCQKLGLDTREICRKAYHQPVQAFLSTIHPKLRFDRNYEAIRPYQDYCEEIISLSLA